MTAHNLLLYERSRQEQAKQRRFRKFFRLSAGIRENGQMLGILRVVGFVIARGGGSRNPLQSHHHESLGSGFRLSSSGLLVVPAAAIGINGLPRWKSSFSCRWCRRNHISPE